VIERVEPVKSFDVAGCGSMVVDSIHSAPRIIGPDEKVALEPDADGVAVRRFVGGVTLNHLAWARILGLRVAAFGKQADDPNGRFLREGMRRVGIEPRIDVSGSSSSFANVYVDPSGARSIYMVRGATAELSPEEIETRHRASIEAARVVTSEVSQVPLAAVRRTFELARAAGARTVLDLDVPLADAVPLLGSDQDLQAILEMADVIKPSRAATAGLVSATEPERIAAELAERTGAEAVVITLGERGAVLAVAGDSLWVASARVRVVDTTGAGDAFLGGLLAGMQLGLDWERAARLGNACGACCCEQLGAFPEAPARRRARVLELWDELDGGSLALSPLEEPGGEAVEHFLGTAASELPGVAAKLDREALARATRLLLDAEAGGGRVHVTGVGKPEHVARYAAALLASTGTAAAFLHATEATHGGVGQLLAGDVVIAISNSGETRELLEAVAAARALDVRVLAVTARADSPLGRAADVVLEARVAHEGGPLDLAPRLSVLAEMLALAALSVALQESRGFTRGDYARLHPAGALGHKSRSR